MRKLTQEEFLARLPQEILDKYSFEKVVYTKSRDKVIVTCPHHGDFTITAGGLIQGEGCPYCAGNKKLSTEEFLERSLKAHGNLYLYDKVAYTGTANKVTITCRVHGDFEQNAGSHMNGRGCPWCDTSRQLTKEEVIGRSVKQHGNKYDYNRVVFCSTKQKIEIGCPIHGWFWQTPEEHINGSGCKKCANTLGGFNRRIPLEVFVRDAIESHRASYDYSKVEFETTADTITIGCPIHGDFQQTANTHRHGGECPKCNVLGGFKESEPGWLYVLQSGGITKLGISNKGAHVRSKHISNESGMPFKVLTAILFKDGRVTRMIETRLLRELRVSYTNIDEDFNGSTECFLDVDYDQLLLRIAQVGIEVFSIIKE